MKRGEVVSIGPHRIMCGDSQDPADVRILTGQKAVDLIFSSPPYARRRDYEHNMECWDYMMRKVSSALPAHRQTQILFNLGLIHEAGSWDDYWSDWIKYMIRLGFKKTGFYVWDKGGPIPGRFAGRLSPRHEFVFHFCREITELQKTQLNRRAGETFERRSKRKRNGALPPRDAARGGVIQSHRVMDSIVIAHVTDPTAVTSHPAVFPVSLPQQFIETFSRPGHRVFDPFSGSGTTVLAAMRTGRVGLGMEVSPNYAAQSVQRLRQAWDRLAAPRPRVLA